MSEYEDVCKYLKDNGFHRVGIRNPYVAIFVSGDKKLRVEVREMKERAIYR